MVKPVWSLTAALLLAGLLIWWSPTVRERPVPTATAEPCPSEGERWARAEVVVRGTVFAVLPGESTQALVVITPTAVLKGTIDAPTVVVTAVDDTKSAGTVRSELHFASGPTEYLLYLHRAADGRYRTRACDGSRALPTDGSTYPEAT